MLPWDDPLGLGITVGALELTNKHTEVVTRSKAQSATW